MLSRNTVYTPASSLHVRARLNNLSQSLISVNAAAVHVDNVAAKQKFTMKISNNDNGDGEGKRRFWTNLRLHHDVWVADGKILNPSQFAAFWDGVRNMPTYGVMCYECFSMVLGGEDEAWVDLHDKVWDTPKEHVEIMREKGVAYWLKYYKKNLVYGRDASAVKLQKPKSRKRFRDRESIDYIGIPPFDLLSEVALPHKRRRTNYNSCNNNNNNVFEFGEYDTKRDTYNNNNNNEFSGSRHYNNDMN
eukprot:463314_1